MIESSFIQSVNASCIFPNQGMNITSSTSLCNGIYNINDPYGTGVIKIKSGGITLDLNGSVFIGDGSGRAIVIDGNYNSVILKNGTINNYYSAIKLRTGDLENIDNISFSNNIYSVEILTDSHNNMIKNSAFVNMTTAGIFISNSQYTSIINNTFNNTDFIYGGSGDTTGYIYGDSGAIGTTIRNNIFYPSLTNKPNIRLVSSSNVIYNNTFLGRETGSYQGITIPTMGSNTQIGFNTFTQYQYPIWTNTANNIYIFNNTITLVDTGSRLGGTGINFYNNTIENVTGNYDTYDIGLKMYNVTNFHIYNNKFIHSGKTGILLMNAHNGDIHNNSIDGISLEDRFNYPISDTEPNTGIRVTTAYIGWIGEGLDPSIGSTSTLNVYKSSDIEIFNNTITNYSVLLWTEGSSNITHNLDSLKYWFVNSTFVNWLYNSDEYYISNEYSPDGIVIYSGKRNYLLNKQYRNVLYGRYSINKTKRFYSNTGTKSTYIVMNESDSTIWHSDRLPVKNNIKNGNNIINISLNSNSNITLEKLNATITPPKNNSYEFNISKWETSNNYEIDFNESSDSPEIEVEYKIGDRQPNSNYSIKKYWNNGTKFEDVFITSNNTGWLNYNSTVRYSQYVIIETAPASPKPYIVIVTTITVIVGGIAYYFTRIRKVQK